MWGIKTASFRPHTRLLITTPKPEVGGVQIFFFSKCSAMIKKIALPGFKHAARTQQSWSSKYRNSAIAGSAPFSQICSKSLVCMDGPSWIVSIENSDSPTYIYRNSGNFCVENFSCINFACKKNFRVGTSDRMCDILTYWGGSYIVLIMCEYLKAPRFLQTTCVPCGFLF